MGAGAFRRKYGAPNEEDINSQWRKPRSKAEIKKAQKSGLLRDHASVTKKSKLKDSASKSPLFAEKGLGAGDVDTQLADAAQNIWRLLMEMENAKATDGPGPKVWNNQGEAEAKTEARIKHLQDTVEIKAEKHNKAQLLLRGAHGRHDSAVVEFDERMKISMTRAIPGTECNWQVEDIAIRKGDVHYIDSIHQFEGVQYFEVHHWSNSDTIGTESNKLHAPVAEDRESLKKLVSELKLTKTELETAEADAEKTREEMMHAHEQLRLALNLPDDEMIPPPPTMFGQRVAAMPLKTTPRKLGPETFGNLPPSMRGLKNGFKRGTPSLLPDMDLVKKWGGPLEADQPKKSEPTPYPEVHGLKENPGSLPSERKPIGQPEEPKQEEQPNEPSEPEYSKESSEYSKEPPQSSAEAPQKTTAQADHGGPAGFPSLERLNADCARRASVEASQAEEARLAAEAAQAAYPSAYCKREDLRPKEKGEKTKADIHEEPTLWQKIVNPDQGVYYANIETEETAWEIPPGGRLVVEKAFDDGDEEEADPFEHLRQRPWDPQEDAPKTQPFRGDTAPMGFPSMEKLKKEEAQRASAEAQPQTGQETHNKRTPDAEKKTPYPEAHTKQEEFRRSTPPEQPTRWRHLIHPTEGIYYVNIETNETAWEMPPMGKLVVEETFSEPEDPFEHLRQQQREQEEAGKQWNDWYQQYTNFCNKKAEEAEAEKRARAAAAGQAYARQQNERREQQNERWENAQRNKAEGGGSSSSSQQQQQQQQQHQQREDPVRLKEPTDENNFQDRAAYALKTGIQTEMKNMIQRPLAERKKALRTLQLQWHPDKNPDKEEIAKEIFQFIEESKKWFLSE